MTVIGKIDGGKKEGGKRSLDNHAIVNRGVKYSPDV